MKDEGTAQPLFRASADDLRRIDAGVAEISEIQRQLRDRHLTQCCSLKLVRPEPVEG